jgi:glycosyltransferase involved in cell wall biosynthesis
MKIIEILPELDIGGVERHVIDLSNELAERGHSVLVLSAGGKMLCQLSQKTEHRILPVHKKNPFTGYLCARKIAAWIKKEGWQIIHAHSRVPAWIADWASSMSGIPFLVTAHVDFGNKSRWIYRPYRRAARVICVSGAVRDGMKECFYDNTQVILNGLGHTDFRWSGTECGVPVKFLFVGRLAQVKGLQDVLKAMPSGDGWTLEVIGDGPMRRDLEELSDRLGLINKVKFYGYSDRVDEFMARSSCLLFPSYIEGMPLTLARAVQIGIPVIASNIAPVAEMAGTDEGLLPPGDIAKWNEAIRVFINTGKTGSHFPVSCVPTLKDMVDKDLSVYYEIAGK